MNRPPFAVRDLGEIAVRCRDLDRMTAFYRDALGLEVLAAPRDGIVFFRIAAGHAGHTRVLALFRAEAEPPGSADRSTLHHLALNVDFAAQQAAVDWFEALGLAPRVETFGWIGWRGVFLTDPEGNSVELVAHSRALEAPE